jgi:hypothetical protein
MEVVARVYAQLGNFVWEKNKDAKTAAGTN